MRIKLKNKIQRLLLILLFIFNCNLFSSSYLSISYYVGGNSLMNVKVSYKIYDNKIEVESYIRNKFLYSIEKSYKKYQDKKELENLIKDNDNLLKKENFNFFKIYLKNCKKTNTNVVLTAEFIEEKIPEFTNFLVYKNELYEGENIKFYKIKFKNKEYLIFDDLKLYKNSKIKKILLALSGLKNYN